MYICSDCGAMFDEPKEVSWKEEMSGDGWAWQTFTDLLCPECGSQEIEQAYEVSADEA